MTQDRKKAFQHKQHKASAKCLGLHNSSFLITVFYEEKKIVEHFYSLAFNIFIESLQQSFNQCETGHNQKPRPMSKQCMQSQKRGANLKMYKCQLLAYISQYLGIYWHL